MRLRVRSSGECIHVLVNSARSDDKVNIIWLKAHDVTGYDSLRVNLFDQLLQWGMVSNESEWFSSQIMSEVLNSPNHGQDFKLR